MNTLKPYYVVHPNDPSTRYYFGECDLKRANELAQKLANEFGKTVARYDLSGGMSYFYATETTPEGYKIYAGS